MTTITWGATGTYTTLQAAVVAQSFGADDFTFQQAGVSTESIQISWNAYDYGGFTVYITGNGDTVNMGGKSVCEMGTASSTLRGNLVFDGLVVTGAARLFYTWNGTNLGTYNILIKNIIGTGGTNNCIQNSWKLLDSVYIYNINWEATNDNFIYKNTGDAGQNMYIEDCFFTNTTTSTNVLFSSVTTSDIFLKRVYVQSDASVFMNNTVNWAYNNASNEVYTSDTTSDVTYDQIPWGLTDFESITSTDTLYGVPKSTSVLYTTATQTTNIAENLVGLNGETVDYRAAGPYTPPTIINPPTGLAWEEVPSVGIKITWTPTVQTGYLDVDLYWEKSSALSVSVTPGANILSGTNEYTIPFEALTGANLWYVRAAHAAS